MYFSLCICLSVLSHKKFQLSPCCLLLKMNIKYMPFFIWSGNGYKAQSRHVIVCVCVCLCVPGVIAWQAEWTVRGWNNYHFLKESHRGCHSGLDLCRYCICTCTLDWICVKTQPVFHSSRVPILNPFEVAQHGSLIEAFLNNTIFCLFSGLGNDPSPLVHFPSLLGFVSRVCGSRFGIPCLYLACFIKSQVPLTIVHLTEQEGWMV